MDAGVGGVANEAASEKRCGSASEGPEITKSLWRPAPDGSVSRPRRAKAREKPAALPARPMARGHAENRDCRFARAPIRRERRRFPRQDPCVARVGRRNQSQVARQQTRDRAVINIGRRGRRARAARRGARLRHVGEAERTRRGLQRRRGARRRNVRRRHDGGNGRRRNVRRAERRARRRERRGRGDDGRRGRVGKIGRRDRKTERNRRRRQRAPAAPERRRWPDPRSSGGRKAPARDGPHLARARHRRANPRAWERSAWGTCRRLPSNGGPAA